MNEESIPSEDSSSSSFVPDEDENHFPVKNEISIAPNEPSQPEEEVAPADEGQFIDVSTEFGIPQNKVAQKLGMHPSTFSKRWNEATQKRKWPYRDIHKIDKELATIAQNLPSAGEEVKRKMIARMNELLHTRNGMCLPVYIRKT